MKTRFLFLFAVSFALAVPAILPADEGSFKLDELSCFDVQSQSEDDSLFLVGMLVGHVMGSNAVTADQIQAAVEAMDVEIAGLRVGDVYDEAGDVRAKFTMTGTQTKGGDTRTVYVNRKHKHVLEQYRSVVGNRNRDDALFLTQQRTNFSANTMCQLFIQIYKDCGLRGATSHSDRRTFITKLANTGINVRLLAALAGHKNISTTQRYIDVNDTQLAKAVELI